MSVILDKLLKGQKVEWLTLAEIAEIGTGSRNTNEAKENGKYDFYVRSQKPLKINEYEFDEIAILTAGDGVGVGKVFHYVDGKYALHQRAYRIKVLGKNVNTKFLFYIFKSNFSEYLKSISVHASVTSLRKPMFEKYLVPVPPLDVQNKIVKILDAFTALTAELTAELTMRKKQYHYYRDKLLTFSDDVKRKKLGEVVNIKNGKDWKNLGQGDVPVYGSGGIMTYVDKASYNNVSVLIPRKGSITNIFYTEQPFWNVDTIFYTEIDESQIFPKFFFHFMKNFDLTTLSTDTTRPSLTQAILNKILIPLPSLERQKHIANTLDKFEILTNSITEGLPKEIALRQQQYEYYREQLLDFSKE